VMPMPSSFFGASSTWRGKHWHAYMVLDSVDDPVSRWRRLQREPDTVLDNPFAVAEWIEQRMLNLGARRAVSAVADHEWVEIKDAEDLAHLYGEHMLIASRGDSVYVDVYHPPRRVELFVEAVSRRQCEHHMTTASTQGG